DQLLADRGFIGNLLLEDVGLVGADQAQRTGVALGVLQGHVGAQVDDRGAAFLALDDGGAGDDFLEVGNAGLVGALLLSGVVVGGTFTNVAVRNGGTHVVADFLTTNVLQVTQLFLDLLETVFGQVNRFTC